MTTYYTAADDDQAVQALKNPPTGDEVLTSDIAPDDDRFTALIELVTGKQLDQLDGDEYTVRDDVATDATQSVVALGSGLVAQIADRDAQEFTDLAGPWSATDAFDGSADPAELVDYLTDLQHLARNAAATNGGVYAVESF
ncbi:hypothetical protein [Naumannella cuiyingiana]|uniref:DUF1877 family protein n=1 Tax=Naumannella cuiyingiana TaxID=1347891 RepID=A0A7Z0DCA0_9ACTN|nr:hypothetical protein [Naumannella cuiyingiana]NYI72669.1 hypothetical protein [Naumannella cuiyingiana]